MADNGFTSISVNNLIMERIEKIFYKAGFSTKSSYIQDRLRDSVEKDFKKYGGEKDEDDKGDITQS